SDTSIPIPEWEVHGPWPTMPWWEDYEYYDQTNPKRQSPWLNNTQVYPKGMALKMEPADLWAIANLRFKELPPVEFDRPVGLWVEIMDIPTEAGLREVCGYPPYDGKILVGCAELRPGDLCHIFVGPPQYERTGVTRNIVIRHEMGHCNGWGKDHAGMR